MKPKKNRIRITLSIFYILISNIYIFFYFKFCNGACEMLSIFNVYQEIN